jgi:hypothetical protein
MSNAYDSDSISAPPRLGTAARGGDIQPENADPIDSGYNPVFGSPPVPDVGANPRMGGDHLEGTQISDTVEPVAPRLSPGSPYDSPTQ